MDSNAALATIRLLQVSLSRVQDPDRAGQIALNIAENFRLLDDHLSNGGRLPDAWQPPEQTIVDAILDEDES